MSRVGFANCVWPRGIVQLSPNLGVVCRFIGHVLHLEARHNLVVWLQCSLSAEIIDDDYEDRSLKSQSMGMVRA